MFGMGLDVSQLLSGEGLVRLVVPTEQDAVVWFRLFAELEVMQHIGNGTLRDLVWYYGFVSLQREVAKKFGFCLFSVFVDQSCVGFTGLQVWKQVWGPNGEVELGWRLGKKYWGLGYATEAAKQTLTIAKNLNISPMSMINQTNVRSIAVANRLSMKFKRNYTNIEGNLVAQYVV